MNAPHHSFTPDTLTKREEMQRRLVALGTAASDCFAKVDGDGGFWHSEAGLRLAYTIWQVTKSDDARSEFADLAYLAGRDFDEAVRICEHSAYYAPSLRLHSAGCVA